MLLTFISEPPSAVFGLSPSVGRAVSSRQFPKRTSAWFPPPSITGVDFSGDCRRHLRYGAALLCRLPHVFRRVFHASTPRAFRCTCAPETTTPIPPGSATCLTWPGQRDHVLRRQAELCVLPSGRQACVRARWARLLQPNVAWGCLHRRGRYAICRKRGPRGGRGIGSLRHRGNSHRARSGSEQGPRGARRSFCVRGSTTGRSGMFTNV